MIMSSWKFFLQIKWFRNDISVHSKTIIKQYKWNERECQWNHTANVRCTSATHHSQQSTNAAGIPEFVDFLFPLPPKELKTSRCSSVQFRSVDCCKMIVISLIVVRFSVATYVRRTHTHTLNWYLPVRKMNTHHACRLFVASPYWKLMKSYSLHMHT